MESRGFIPGSLLEFPDIPQEFELHLGFRTREAAQGEEQF